MQTRPHLGQRGILKSFNKKMELGKLSRSQESDNWREFSQNPRDFHIILRVIYQTTICLGYKYQYS